MKKSLIALAALATVGAAQAQSSVTVYGLLDMGAVSADYKNIGGATTAAAQREVMGLNSGIAGAGASASSRLGFRGVEDLGGGLTAGFNYELAISPASSANDTASGNGTLTASPARESKVSLSSKTLGTIELGYGTTGLHSTIAGHRALGATNFWGDLAYSSDGTSGISGADQRIHENAVRASGVTYRSPVFNGLSARVDVGRSSDKTDQKTQTGGRNLGVTLNYNVGNLSVAATNHNYYTQSAVDALASKFEYQAISAAYKLTKDLTLDALYAKRKAENGATGVQSRKDDVQQVGVRYAMGKTTLTAMYGTGEGESTVGADRLDRTGMQLGAQYNLSKRTAAYALYGSQDAKYVATGVKEKVAGYAVGLRHSF